MVWVGEDGLSFVWGGVVVAAFASEQLKEREMALAVVELYCYATICSNPPFSPLISGPEASMTSTNRACPGLTPLSVYQVFTSPTTALMAAA